MFHHRPYISYRMRSSYLSGNTIFVSELRRKFGKMGIEKIKGETGKWQFTPRIGGLQDN